MSKLFLGWLRMSSHCAACGMKYDRAPGYFLGAIYFNYGLTAMLVTILYFALYFTEPVPRELNIWIASAFILIFPLFFFRYARSLWIAFDQYFDPLPEDEAREDRA